MIDYTYYLSLLGAYAQIELWPCPQCRAYRIPIAAFLNASLLEDDC